MLLPRPSILSILCVIQLYQYCHMVTVTSLDFPRRYSLSINTTTSDYGNGKLSTEIDHSESIEVRDKRGTCRDCAHCGVLNKRSRIVGGVIAEPYEFPWLVALLKDGNFKCAGSIITKYHVLTAAHCVHRTRRIDSLKAEIGVYDLNDKNDKRRKIGIKEIIAHPKFDMLKHINDIAILKLKSEIKFDSRHIQPACLPTYGHRNYAGITATAIGWGFTVEDEFKLSPKVRKVEVPIITSDQCRRSVDITPFDMCAGYAKGGKDACSGDSGGPLQIPRSKSGTMRVVGVTSGGLGCARPNMPGVYTQIDHYIYWINSKIGGACICED